MKKLITQPLMVLLLFAIAIKSNAQWNLTGNSNATSTSILGTTNAIPLNLTTNNVSRLVIDANGKVGIGTSAPVNILTVKGSGGTPASSWVNSGAPLFAGFGEQITGNADYILSMASSLAGGRPVFIGRRSKGTLAVPAVVANNDFLMSFLSSGYDGSGFQNPAGIDFYVDGTPSAGNVPARISFVTGSNSSTRAERLKIGNTGDITVNTNQLFVQKATGNVGLGTITPAARLDVKTTSPYFAQFNGGNQMYMGLFENDIYRGYLGSYSGAAEDVDFGTGTGNTTGKLHLTIQGTPKFTIDASGNVGVGTTAPAAKMDVVGNIKIADGTQGLGKVLTSDANGMASWNTLSSIVETDPKVGILSNDKVPKWSGSTLVDGLITDNGTNVGIGTTTPAAKLDVKSTGPYVAQFNGAAPMYMGLFENDVYRGYLGSYAGAAEDVDFGTGSGNVTGKLHLTIQASPKLTINGAGQVGIGTTTPNHLMHIKGGDLFVESSSGLIRLGYEGSNEWQMATTGGGSDLRWYTTTDGGATIIPRHYFSQNGNMGVGGFSGPGVPLGRLDVIGAGTTSSTNNLILRNFNLDTLMRVLDNGRIGIGYNGPSYGRTVNLGGTGINFYTASEAAFGGAVFPTDTSLVIWSNNGANNYLVLQPSWGNVGVGTSTPDAKLHVRTGVNAAVTGGGYFEVGATTGTNIVMDPTQIMARNAGAAASLILNNGSGNVGIGTAAPASKLEVNGTAAKPGGGSWTATSDARLKQNVNPYTDGLEQLKKINPVSYNYNALSGYDTKPQYVGVLAQELKDVAPYMVSNFKKDDKDYYQVDNSAMTYMLVNAVKELAGTNNAKDKTINDLQSTVSKQQQQINDILSRLNDLQSAQQACCNAVSTKEITVADKQQSVSLTNASLEQNIPNPPVNNATRINYNIPNNSTKAEMIITDVYGKKLKQITLTNKGKGNLNVDTSGLAAGTYSYTLLVDGKVIETRKMVVAGN